MVKFRKITQFGSPVLRTESQKIPNDEIDSRDFKALVKDMKSLLKDRKLGIGLAAPQVGESKAVAVIEIQKTDLREDDEKISLVITNPEILEVYGRRSQMWEGCISSGKNRAEVFAKVPRYKKVKLKYQDENGDTHTKEFSGLAAHVIQHEVDHLNGVLFVDKVKDTSTFMTYDEYKKMQKNRRKNKVK